MNTEQFLIQSSKQTLNDNCDCNRNAFLAWQHLESLPNSLTFIGEFEHKEDSIKENGYSEYHPAGTSYWSKEAPIAIYFYPYHECRIYQCRNCSALFLHYTEHGGHGSEKRLRWVNPKLVNEHNR